MSLLLGLGNPGERYRETRHNLGFAVVEELARRRQISLDTMECKSFLGEDGTVALATPQTYMNRSGYAVRCLVERRAFAPENILLVYDDVNLALGRLRLRRAGSPGGHRGMESVIENLCTDQIPRLRLGIAPEEPEEKVLFGHALPVADRHFDKKLHDSIIVQRADFGKIIELEFLFHDHLIQVSRKPYLK